MRNPRDREPEPQDEARPEDEAFRRFQRSGRPEDLGAVFDATALGLTVLATHLARDTAEAEDLVQQTFLVALRDAEWWDGARPVRAWLAGILRHRALDAARQHRARRTAGLDDLAESAAGGATPLELAASREAAAQIAVALDQLDGPSRQVLALRVAHGLTPTAIAHALGRRPGTVRMQLQRGLERLRLLVPAGAAPAALAAWLGAESRGLADVRRAVLADGALPAATVTTAPVLLTTTTVRAFLVQKWIFTACGLLALGLVARLLFGESPSSLGSPSTPKSPEGELGAAPSMRRPDDAEQASVANAASAPTRAAVEALEGAGSEARTITERPDAMNKGHLRAAGVVLDLDGQPIAGATIQKVVERRQIDVARSDVEGRFEVLGLAPDTLLVARSAGWQPSQAERVRAEEVLRLELVLGAVGHRVHGQVVDALGTPVPSALVAFGTDEDSREAKEGTVRGPESKRGKPMDLEGVVVRTDAEGRFDTDEVPAGYMLVVARGDGDSPLVGWSQQHIAFGGEARVGVVARPGASISGRVRDSAGRPLPGRVIEAEWEGTPALGQFEDELGALISDRVARTDDDGRFSLVGLLPGDYDLRVLDGPVECVHHELELREAENTTWDPVVPHAAALRLHVVGPDGAPLSRWRVRAMRLGDYGLDQGRSVDLDSEGRGVLRALPTLARYDLAFSALRPDGRYDERVDGVRDGVAASDDEVEVQLSRSELVSTAVRGRWPIELASIEDVGLVLDDDRRGGEVRVPLDDDGGFEVLGMPAGAYRLATRGLGFPYDETLAEFQLAAGESVDLGTLVLPHFTRLDVRILGEGDEAVVEAELILFDQQGQPNGRLEAGVGRWTSAPLRQGRVTLIVSSASHAPLVQVVEVGGLPLQDVELRCVLGRVVVLAIESNDSSSPAPVAVELRVTRAGEGDERDQRLLSRSLARAPDAERLIERLRLAPGTYELEIRDRSPMRRGSARHT